MITVAVITIAGAVPLALASTGTAQGPGRTHAEFIGCDPSAAVVKKKRELANCIVYVMSTLN